jgi:F0F1-type ATP synthase assembly protein I
VPDPKDLNRLLRTSHLGIQFVLVFGLFAFLGFYADEKLGTLPLFLLLGVAVGFAIAFYQLYVAVFGVGGVSGKRQGPPDAKS